MSWSRRGRIRIGNRRRGVDNFEGTGPGGAEVGVVELQFVRFGQEFLGIECVVGFQKLKIFA